MQKVIFNPKPNRLFALSLPVYVRSTGYNEAGFDWSENHPPRGFVQIFWSVKGSGEFTFGDRKEILKQGESIYRMPDEPHVHRALLREWHYYWITFDGSDAGKFMNSYGYSQRPMPSGDCPVYLFEEAAKLIANMSPFSQRKLVSVLTDILALMGGCDNDSSRAGNAVREFISLVQDNYRNASLNINAFADMMGMHRTTLNRLFRQKMMISPVTYLIQFRIQRALSLLRETAMPVSEIADKVGIPQRSHFGKVIRKATGVSPLEYRENKPAK